ncbi:MAG: hypothetical protein LCH91_16865 [Bacteroidetes bacterium]|nr:hypothetical protein [Bacteroidota bacterium]
MQLEVVNKEKVIQFCQQILADNIRKSVRIVLDFEQPYETRYSLNLDGYNFVGANDKGRLVKVVPFYRGYWLHFSIEFDLQSRSSKSYDYYLKGVALAIFYGSEATNEEKLLMFRAEWDNKNDEDTRTDNPQPHWHFQNADSYVKAEYVADFNVFMGFKEEESTGFLEEIGEIRPQPTPKSVNISGFHFAMSAGWIFEQPHKHILTEKSLKVWLDKTLKHIKQQLEHYC